MFCFSKRHLHCATVYSQASLTFASLILFCAGIAKVWSVGPAYLFHDIIISREIHILIGIIEISLGILAFTFAKHFGIRLLIGGILLTFLTILVLKSWNGANYCNCIPGIESPLALMFVVDLLLLLGIMASMFVNVNWDSNRRRRLRGVYIAAGILALLLRTQFATGEEAFHFLAGQTITVDQAHKVSASESEIISITFV